MKQPTKRDLQAEETYRKLVDTSMELVKEYGYHKVTVSQICAASGYAKGTFYNYFNSKRDILNRLAIELNERLADTFSYDESQSCTQLYLQFVNDYMRIVKEDGHDFSKNCMQMLISESMSGDEVRLDIQQKYLYELIERGQKQGEFTSGMTKEAFFDLWRATVLGVITLWAIEKEHYDLTQEGRQSLSAIIRLM
ncbi:TetR/AcrR family transcriptional regulator [Anoxynatronum buryatiense]|uniref:TetR/AcrR family transcriptional regulator n=1 Tax=Anoxynatronum buryatiense TaxID=489973 RepID=UPI0024B6AD17|nr:TetR/AcrR family transcriptional regulator [Anoxynatronum buryatiense]